MVKQDFFKLIRSSLNTVLLERCTPLHSGTAPLGTALGRMLTTAVQTGMFGIRVQLPATA